MKKTVLIILCAALMLSLCACSSSAGQAETVIAPTEAPATAEPAPELTPEPTAEPTAEPTPEIDLAAETVSMTAVLDLIDSDSRPGTAGCSLVAVRLAAEMLNWAQSTLLSDAQVADAAQQWLASKGYGAQSEFNMKLDLVYSAYQSLIAPGSKDLMDSAGVEYDEGAWGYETVSAVEALESAVGPSDVVR